ncbi:MAG TPA: AAA family ATPase [Candidatus Solibacter sp.]|jgi:predicted ATPase|nr:AAA family ATPase [Candidatus Solibacter sp.]
MADYSRSVSHHSRAADKIQAIVQRYPEGVTFEELMRDKQECLKDRNSVLAAIRLLIEEGKIQSERPWSGEGFLDDVKLYVPVPSVGVIRSIRIENLLSFGADNPPLELHPLNVLIGPNGSGKSSLIEVLGLLQSTGRDLSEPIREGGGITEWLWKGTSKRKSATSETPVASIEVLVARAMGARLLRYKLSFTKLGSALEILDERIENELPDGDNNKPYFYYGYEKGRRILNVKEKKRELKREDVDPKQSILSQRKDPDQYPEVTYLGRTFSRFAFYRDWEFGINSEPRQIHVPDQQSEYLEENASNLALLLTRMKADPPIKNQLLRYLQEFYQEAVDLNADIKQGLLDLSLEERGGFTTPAVRMSAGTLRWLSLLAILLNPTPPSLVCIEEPELGLHPDIIPALARLLKEASQRMQIVVTTHSEALVEELTETAESVIVCEKHNGSTVLRRLQMIELSKWLSEYSLGQLWRKGEIGGTRW